MKCMDFLTMFSSLDRKNDVCRLANAVFLYIGLFFSARFLALACFLHCFRGGRRPQSEPEEETEGEKSEAEAGHLGTGKESEVLLRIVAAQVFEREAHEAVEHDVEGEALSACMTACAEDEEEGEDDDVELSLPDLRRPERLRAVGMVGEGGVGIENAEAAACRRAECVPVEEVRTAAERLSEDDGGRGNVHKVNGVEPVFPTV